MATAANKTASDNTDDETQENTSDDRSHSNRSVDRRRDLAGDDVWVDLALNAAANVGRVLDCRED